MDVLANSGIFAVNRVYKVQIRCMQLPVFLYFIFWIVSKFFYSTVFWSYSILYFTGINFSIYYYMHTMYSRILIIQMPECHFNVKGIQINEVVRISELSDKYTGQLHAIMILHIMVNQLCGQMIISHMLICFSTTVL